MVEDLAFTAPDGPAVLDVRPSGCWPWVVLTLGALTIAVGGVLLSHGSDDQSAVMQATSVTGSEW